MNLHKNKAWLIAYFLLFITATVLCLRLVHEPDLWWQLRTGEYILENKTVPDVDVFSYTYEGKPWLNVKWGFEVVQATVVKYFGPAFLPIPQIGANILLLLTIIVLFRQFSFSKNLSRFAKHIALLLLLIGLSYRMNGRPELSTYLFTSVYLLIFTGNFYGKKTWIYALIPLQMLWANLHEAYGVGMVMMAIYLAANWYEFYFKAQKTAVLKEERNRNTLVILIAMLSVMIHPSGSRMLFHPYEIFTQLSENQFTAEILGASSKAYWQMPAYVSLLFIILSTIALFGFPRKKGLSQIKTVLQNIPIFYVLLLLAFFYLSLKSYRNIPFLLIVASPLVALQISLWTKKFSEKSSLIVAFALVAMFYLSIVSNTFYKAFLPAEVYGLGINPAKNPVGAAQFIAENNINGNGFTDYLGSSYLLWKLQPAFKTFVDLRDLDVFAAEDIEIAITCSTNPQRKTADGRKIWQLVDGIYNFNYVAVLNNAAFVNIHRYLYFGNDFTLVYADELASIYLKNTPMNKPLIDKYGSAKTEIPFQPTEGINARKQASFISSLFWPWHKYTSQSKDEFILKRNAYRTYLGEINSK